MHFLVMEFARGSDLYKKVRADGPLGLSLAVECVTQAAAGLQHAHEKGIIHRDIKPGNLILTDKNTIKILDLGLASIGEEAELDGEHVSHLGDQSQLTCSGSLLGTVAYMAPEQATDSASVDARSDIYALGCTFYFLITGETPFGSDPNESIARHQQDPIPNLRDKRPDLPDALDEILQRMLAKSPDDRQQTMSQVIMDFRSLDEPVGRISGALGRGRDAPSAADGTSSSRRLPDAGRQARYRWFNSVDQMGKSQWPWMIGGISAMGFALALLYWTTEAVSGRKTVAENRLRTSPPIPASEAQSPPHDPIMGDLAGDVPPPTRPRQPSGLEEALKSALPQKETDASTSESSRLEPDTIMAPQPLSDEASAAADRALANVRTLIRKAKWKEMMRAAHAAKRMPMNSKQKADAEALCELVDLAAYYRGAIETGVFDKLEFGDVLEVTDGFYVMFVEKGDGLLVVRYRDKTRSYTFDELPFSLAHRLAAFSIPNSQTSRAAMAAYQAIAPKSTPAHRDEAVGWLRTLGGDAEGADPRRMAETIESLFRDGS